jgi:RNA polymerase sigma-70 factor, ECF subfamily
VSSGPTEQPLNPLLAVQGHVPRVPAPIVAMELNDEDLVLRMEKGDRKAVASLFDRYADLLYAIGLRILRDRHEAEDLVQDVFLHLFEKAKGFDPSKGSGRTWIVQIAYRRAFDRRTSLGRRQFRTGIDLEQIKNTSDGPVVFGDRITDQLTGRQLHAAFDQLNEKQRLTLHMHFFEGLNLREISERLSETLENTRHFYYRGLERLRRAGAVTSRRERKKK